MKTNDLPLVFLSFMIIFPTAIMCFLPMKNRLKMPLPRLMVVGSVILLPLVLVATAVEYYMDVSINMVMLPLVLISFILYVRSVDADISVCIAIFLWCWSMMSSISNMAAAIDAVYNPKMGADDVTAAFVISQQLIAIAWIALSAYPVIKYGTRIIDNLKLRNIWYASTPVTAIYLSLNFLIRPLHYDTLYTNKVFIAFIAVIAALFVTQIFLTVLFYYIVNEIDSHAQLAERTRLLEMQESQYITQQKYIEATARERHDFRHAVRTLDELLRAGDLTEMRRFLDDYIQAMPKNTITRYCNINAVNALLNYYAGNAEEYGIKLLLEIDIPDNISIGTVELCSLLGNILENAVNACLEVPTVKRFIHLSVMNRDDTALYIVSTNCYGKKLRIKDGKYLSTHRRRNGLGLRSIAWTAQSYGGLADFSNDEENFYINVKIPLHKGAEKALDDDFAR